MPRAPRLSLDDVERARAALSPAHFIDSYCQVEDKAQGAWLPFRLWDVQRDVLSVLAAERFVVALKARQLGFTWLVLGYALWHLVYRRGAVLLFSQGEKAAWELMRRLQEMHARLPDGIRLGVAGESKEALELASGATAQAFATTGRAGRSYTGSFALIDEADYVPDLNDLLNAVKPTVDAGGRLVLLSTPDKSRPASAFKRVYVAARKGENEYRPVFHGWQARPGRTAEWYAQQQRAILAQTGSLDDLHQEYPATPEEALAPRSLDKRIAPEWLQQCYLEMTPLVRLPVGAPSIPGLAVYVVPRPGRRYVIGGDPAEGNPTSDDSALTVLDWETGEEVAALAGKFQPAVLAAHADTLGRWYNGAPVMVERNNHGHAVLLWLRDNSRLRRLLGHDRKEGWFSSTKGKALLYDACADAFREHDTVLHSFATYVQLASIEGSTLRAPEDEHDDRADGYALALAAVSRAPRPTSRPAVITPGLPGVAG